MKNRAVNWTFHSINSFGKFAAIWDELNRNTFDTPLLDSSFVQAALHHFGTGQEQLAIALDSHGLAAVCIFCTRAFGRLEAFQPSQMPLGPWIQRKDIDLAVLVTSLIRRCAATTFMSSLTQLDPLLIPRPTDGSFVKTLPYIMTGVVDLPDSFDQYMQERSKNLHANLRRRLRKAEHEHGPLSLQVLDAPSNVRHGIELYADIESSGWKAEFGTALKRGDTQSLFYRDIIEAFAGHRNGRIYLLYFGKRLAAAELAVIRGGTIYLLKTTHDERLRNCSPGVLLKRQLIESLFLRESGVRRIEMYGPVNDSQRPWISSIRQMYHANVYRSSVFAGVHWLIRRSRVPHRPTPPHITRI